MRGLCRMERKPAMIKFFLSEDKTVKSLEAPCPGCWISMTAPNDDEIKAIAAECQVEADALKAALDIDERSRIEVDDNYTMILTNIPTVETDNQKELYSTIPLSVIITHDAVITVCSENTPLLRPFEEGRIKDFHTQMKSRFVLQILYRSARLYLEYLRIIDRKSEEVENKLHRSTKNHELIELLKLEKSLVYFTTALRSNESVMEKLFRNEIIKKYPEDAELLDDVIVENKQAIEMANIYSGILSGTMDAFASVISNNLNIVMKVLAIITIVLSVPTMIFSAYGMNVNIAGMPFAQSPWGFAIIIALSVLLSAAVIFLFIKMKMFK